jgi:hypothetical protein
MDLNRLAFHDQTSVKLLASEDYSQWIKLEVDYLKELGIPNDLSEAQLHDQFCRKTKEKISWGLFAEGQLVSVAELNAKAMDLGP